MAGDLLQSVPCKTSTTAKIPQQIHIKGTVPRYMIGVILNTQVAYDSITFLVLRPMNAGQAQARVVLKIEAGSVGVV